MLHFITWPAFNRLIIVLMLLYYPILLTMYYRKDIVVHIRRHLQKT